jgi:hypothetical protein
MFSLRCLCKHMFYSIAVLCTFPFENNCIVMYIVIDSNIAFSYRQYFVYNRGCKALALTVMSLRCASRVLGRSHSLSPSPPSLSVRGSDSAIFVVRERQYRNPIFLVVEVWLCSLLRCHPCVGLLVACVQ